MCIRDRLTSHPKAKPRCFSIAYARLIFGLEIRRTCKRTVGSNPTLSANSPYLSMAYGENKVKTNIPPTKAGFCALALKNSLFPSILSKQLEIAFVKIWKQVKVQIQGELKGEQMNFRFEAAVDAALFQQTKGAWTQQINDNPESVSAVSYTHLDVYKRQRDGL